MKSLRRTERTSRIGVVTGRIEKIHTSADLPNTFFIKINTLFIETFILLASLILTFLPISSALADQPNSPTVTVKKDIRGTFNQHKDKISPNGAMFAATGDVAIGDINGDDKDEILIVGIDRKTIGIFDEHGNRIHLLETVPVANGVLAVGDVNGDGKEEILIIGKDGHTVEFFDEYGKKIGSFDKALAEKAIVEMEAVIQDAYGPGGPGGFGFGVPSATCLGREPTISPGGQCGINNFEAFQCTFGTKGPDVIIGTPFHDLIVGRGGGDVICGLGGDDRIYGDSREFDQILHPHPEDGTPGNDVIDGGPGKDYIFGGPREDALSGSTGDDALFGGHGDDLLLGEEGNDFLLGMWGADKHEGGPGDDNINSVTFDTVKNDDRANTEGPISGTDICRFWEGETFLFFCANKIPYP